MRRIGERAKGIIIGFVLCLVFSTSVVVSAANTSVMREITYGVSVVFNGQPMQFATDSQPFTMEGRTFLPLRAMADMMGLPVEFEQTTNTVYIGNKTVVAPPITTQPTPAGLLSDMQHTRFIGGDIFNIHGTFTSHLGDTYDNGFIFKWDAYKFSEPADADYSLGGQYAKLTGTVVIPRDVDIVGLTTKKALSTGDGINISIYGDGKELLQSTLVTATIPLDFSIDVSRIENLEIKVRGRGGSNAYVGLTNLRLYK